MSKARELANLGNAYSDGALSNRNLIINGAMQVAQRGTSFGGSSFAGYSLDRWRVGAFNGNISVSQQQFTPSGSYPELFKTYLQYEVVTMATTGTPNLHQRIEDVLTANGQTVTLSFWARCTSGTYDIEVWLANDHGGSGGNTGSTSVTLSTTWTEYKLTFTLPEVTGGTTGSATFLRVNFDFPMASGTGTFQITGVQLEVGDTATPFEHRSYGQELALCQRYYQIGSGVYFRAYQVAGAYAGQGFEFKTTMRATPTYTFGGGAYWSNTNINGTPTVAPQNENYYITYGLWNSTGDGRFQPSGTSYFVFDAEL